MKHDKEFTSEEQKVIKLFCTCLTIPTFEHAFIAKVLGTNEEFMLSLLNEAKRLNTSLSS